MECEQLKKVLIIIFISKVIDSFIAKSHQTVLNDPVSTMNQKKILSPYSPYEPKLLEEKVVLNDGINLLSKIIKDKDFDIFVKRFFIIEPL